MSSTGETTDTEEFRRRWNDWLGDLNRLRLAAVSQEDSDDIKEAKETLEEVVESIAADYEEMEGDDE